jgi:hypothetical protein
MTSRCRSQRATIAADEVFASALAKVGRASKVFQDSEGGLDPLLPIFAANLFLLPVRHPPAHLVHGGSQFSWAQFL